jgi:ribulose-phosphate 3-epimerase
MEPLIAPSILSADFGRLTEELRAVEAAGADLIHVDVMDGHFVPNLTIGPMVVAAAKRATKLPLDVHLMIVEPERSIEEFASAGASRLTVHAEACPHLHRTIQQIRKAGPMPGVSLNPSTPLAAVEEILCDVGMVLLMSVNPGFGGQSFIPGTIDKVRRLREMIAARGISVDVEIDGGITPATIGEVSRAGANVFVAGTSIFKHKDYRAAIEELRRNAGNEPRLGAYRDE